VTLRLIAQCLDELQDRVPCSSNYQYKNIVYVMNIGVCIYIYVYIYIYVLYIHIYTLKETNAVLLN